MKSFLLAVVLLFTFSCAVRKPHSVFQVIPAEPGYVLQSPDLEKTPFSEIAGRYTRLASEWVDLRPGMGLRLENAYFREGAIKRDLDTYVGTEVARFRAGSSGRLRLVSAPSSLAARPKDQSPIEAFLPRPDASCRYHRFFYQVLFTSKGNIHTAVLLGARSAQELDRLGSQLLADPESVCGNSSGRCVVFPETCTASVEIEITVNGTRRAVVWGSTLATVILDERLERQRISGGPAAPLKLHELGLQRIHAGRLTPVKMDGSDPEVLRLVVLPGDSLTWN